MLKIVLDTNIFLSALFFGGMAEKIFDLVLARKLQLYVSTELSEEIFKKLRYFGANEAVLIKTAVVLEGCILIKPTVSIAVCRDPKDNFLLEIAETVRADYLVTRDKDLLDLESQARKQTKIIKPEAFLPLLRKIRLLEA